MRILCRHGFLQFYPGLTSDLVDFTNFFGIELVREDDYYTFPALKGLKRYSIVGSPYGAIPATQTYEGRHPWEVLKKNGFVYSLVAKALVPKASIAVNVDPILVDDGFFVCETPLLQPGSRNKVGQQILSYDAFWKRDILELQLVGFQYE